MKDARKKPKPDEIVFSELDDTGRLVVLTQATAQHIKKHPPAAYDLSAIKITIKQPEAVYYGGSKSTEVFQKPISEFSSFKAIKSFEETHMTVPVFIPDDTSKPKRVRTAFYTKSWKGKKRRKR